MNAKPKDVLGNSALLFVLLAAVLFPFISGEYYLHVAIQALMFAVLALSWDVAARAELVSFAHAGFFGLGAYVSALSFLKLGLPLPLCFLAAVLVAAGAALMLGYLTLPLTGIHFAIATLAFTQTLQVVALRLPGLTGGAMGITVPSLFGGARLFSYFLIFALLLVLTGISLYLERSPFRLAFTAMRTSERVAAVLGVNVVRYRLLVFLVSAIFAALAGAFYVHYTSTTIPYEAFSLHIGVASLVMPVFGGLYSTAGPLLGAVVLYGGEEFLRTAISYGYMVVYGLILIVVILFLPRGILGVVRRWNFWK